MPSNLFREEALEYQSASNSRFGKPTGVLPPTWSVITLILALFMVALFAFLLTVDFARKETVRGKLRVDGAEAKLYAAEQGLISEVLVVEGQSVSVGDPIARVTSERYMSDGGGLSEVTLQQFELEREAMARRRQAIETSAEVSIRTAEQRYRDAARQEEEFSSQLEIVTQRLEIAITRSEEAKKFFAEQLITEPQLNERLDAAASLEQMALQIQAQVNEAVASQSRANLERQQLQANLNRDLADVDQRLEQINAQILHTSAHAVHIVRAPIDGFVTSLQARVGEQSVSGMPLGVVLPNDSVLIAEVYLPSRAIGFVESGQQVKLQYDAFPYQKFGSAEGRITPVASTAQFPQEIGLASQSPEPVYRVEIELDSQVVAAYSKELSLQAGMELSADIVLENRRLLEWLLEPLMR